MRHLLYIKRAVSVKKDSADVLPIVLLPDPDLFCASCEISCSRNKIEQTDKIREFDRI